MVSIDQIIQRTVNPFDSTSFRPGNFWHDDNSQQATIPSIHQEIVLGVSQLLNQVEGDRRSRTLVLSGDSGSGKSFLLGRLKRTLNPQAFFAYIGPWPESDYIWRHTLRHTIDSLTCIPDGEQESQLLLWLNSLSAFRDEGLLKKVIGERNLFIHNFKSTYPSGIYNANEFFSILYHLTNPELYPLACDWLKGDDLDHESLKLLNVRSSIETEHQAQNILGNFGRIATATQPIVLCFDNLDNVDRSDRGYIDLQALFNVNSIIHNQKLKNFLVIISIITDTWRENSPHVQPADLARVDQELHLRPVDIPAAIALWESRLFSLHQQADSPPNSSLYPLCEADLHRKFPGNKALPRSVLMLGRQEFQKAKLRRQDNQPIPQEVDQLAAFHLTWEKELAKSRQTVQEIRQFSAPELMKMLREALEALNVTGVEPKLLKSPTYSRYSLSFYWSLTLGRIGVIWIEEPNLNSFCRVMKSCQEALRKNTCQYLYLIRAENLGVPKNQGYRRYQALFVDSIHKHIIPQIESLRILATYHSLVNAAEAGDLLVGDRPVNRQQLKELVIDSEVFQSCRLLQNLGVFERNLGSLLPQQMSDGVQSEESLMQERLKEYMFALVKTQQLVGRNMLMESTRSQFPEINREGIDGAIGVLCDEGAILILNPESDADEQLITVNS